MTKLKMFERVFVERNKNKFLEEIKWRNIQNY